MTADELLSIELALLEAKRDSGYAKCSSWAVREGPRLIEEIRVLRQIVRVNGLRAGASHADIDEVLNGEKAEAK